MSASILMTDWKLKYCETGEVEEEVRRIYEDEDLFHETTFYCNKLGLVTKEVHDLEVHYYSYSPGGLRLTKREYWDLGDDPKLKPKYSYQYEYWTP
jgi:hypothetical protein